MTHNNINEDVKKLLIFMHIPKTGGTTLTPIISKQYPINILYKWYDDLHDILYNNDKFKVTNTLCGHFPFGVHAACLRPFTYITMLRDPVEHVISWFYFRYRSPKHDKYNGSFDEYVNDDKFNKHTVNLQTRFVSGDGNADLERAKDNILKYFTVVGITELFDESVFLMKKELGWDDIHYKRENTNRNRPRKSQIAKSTIDKIKEKNKLDLELYCFAKKILEAKIQNLNSNDRQELEAFKNSHNG